MLRTAIERHTLYVAVFSERSTKTRLLASIYQAITQTVPANPQHADFRFRLFFRFASAPVKLIVYVWFNDEYTLRKAGSKTDVYETFRRMLQRGEVPDSIAQLLTQSHKAARST
jgi:toxin YhaV